MRIYHGKRDNYGATVTFQVQQGALSDLPKRTDLRNHSPTGFEWGYRGSGPAQLALALCAHVVGDQRAELVYQQFKERHIAPIVANEWWLDEETIRQAIEQIEREHAAA